MLLLAAASQVKRLESRHIASSDAFSARVEALLATRGRRTARVLVLTKRVLVLVPAVAVAEDQKERSDQAVQARRLAASRALAKRVQPVQQTHNTDARRRLQVNLAEGRASRAELARRVPPRAPRWRPPPWRDAASTAEAAEAAPCDEGDSSKLLSHKSVQEHSDEERCCWSSPAEASLASVASVELLLTQDCTTSTEDLIRPLDAATCTEPPVSQLNAATCTEPIVSEAEAKESDESIPLSQIARWKAKDAMRLALISRMRLQRHCKACSALVPLVVEDGEEGDEKEVKALLELLLSEMEL